MNEEIKNEALANINELISYIQTGAKQAGDFVVEQTPLLVQEILTYNLIASSLWAVLWFLAFVGYFYLGFKKFGENKLFFFKAIFEYANDSMGMSVFGGFVSLFIPVCAIFSCVSYFMDVIKIHFAPRLYLIEYVSELIK